MWPDRLRDLLVWRALFELGLVVATAIDFNGADSLPIVAGFMRGTDLRGLGCCRHRRMATEAVSSCIHTSRVRDVCESDTVCGFQKTLVSLSCPLKIFKFDVGTICPTKFSVDPSRF